MNEIKCPKCGEVIKMDETAYAAILQQIKTAEFDMEVMRRISEIRQGDEVARKLAMSEKDNEIISLKAKLENKDNEAEAKLVQEQLKAQQALNEKDAEIAKMKLVHESELKAANDQVAMYKDFKARQSTKMIGESLEIHCSNQYNQMMRALLPMATFEKDNDVVDGTKGDFVFRDFAADGTEYISVMFEMKNEADTTATKHKNEDFFEKLDKDRRNKHCEYAVLVSMLESDSDLYNGGIVDVSYRYEKMYVIRPQFFLPLITLLVNASRKTMVYKCKVAELERQSLDVTNFEKKVDAIRDSFIKHYEAAKEKHSDAIEQIDKIISQLQKMKELLTGSDTKLLQAGKDLDGLTVRKMTYMNPTMKALFAAAKEANS